MKKSKSKQSGYGLGFWIAGAILVTAVLVQTRFPPNKANAQYETTPLSSISCYCAGDESGHHHW